MTLKGEIEKALIEFEEVSYPFHIEHPTYASALKQATDQILSAIKAIVPKEKEELSPCKNCGSKKSGELSDCDGCLNKWI